MHVSFSISGGTTWHAAGLVGQLKGTENETKAASYGVDLIPKLEQETGVATGKQRDKHSLYYGLWLSYYKGWKQCGSIQVARSKDRMTFFKRACVASKFVVPLNGIFSQSMKCKFW